VSNAPYGSGTVVLDGIFTFYLAVLLYRIYFRFRLVQPKGYACAITIRDVLRSLSCSLCNANIMAQRFMLAP
jgi:hypothetical protein